MQDILVVIDMQNDFIDGALGTPEACAVVPRIKDKIDAFAGKVFFTRDTHDENYLDTLEGKNLPVPHCLKGSDGWQIHPALEKLRKTQAIDKPSFGSVKLAEVLCAEHEQNPLSSITFVGVCTDICVISNALLVKAYLPEVPLIVDADLCAGVTKESHEVALAAMSACQIIIKHS